MVIWIRKIGRYLLLLAASLFLLSVFTTLIFRWVNPPVSLLMIVRANDKDAEGKKYGIHKDWKKIEEISSHLVLAVVASEDNRFMEHNGFDIKAIREANENNKKGGNKKGASTISMQTAKNVFLWPSRTYIRKAAEVYFTVLIELLWPKKRIMEVYLNIIEMGKGIYGAEKASQLYYKKSAIKLSRSEAAMIAAILPDPRKWDPRRPTNYLYKRQQWILWNMNNIGTVNFSKKKP